MLSHLSWHTLSLFILTTLTTLATLSLLATRHAHAQAVSTPRAPLRLVVIAPDAQLTESAHTLDDILAHSPNITHIRATPRVNALVSAAHTTHTTTTMTRALCAAGAEAALVLRARQGDVIATMFGPRGEQVSTSRHRAPLTRAEARAVLRDTFPTLTPRVLRARKSTASRCPPHIAAPTPLKTSTTAHASNGTMHTAARAVTTTPPKATKTAEPPGVKTQRWLHLGISSLERMRDTVDEPSGPAGVGVHLRARMHTIEPWDWGLVRDVHGDIFPLVIGPDGLGGFGWRLGLRVGPAVRLGEAWTLELMGALHIMSLRADSSPRGGPERVQFYNLMLIPRVNVWLWERVELGYYLGSGGNLLHTRNREESATRGQIIATGLSVGVRAGDLLFRGEFQIDSMLYERAIEEPEGFQHITFSVVFLR